MSEERKVIETAFGGKVFCSHCGNEIQDSDYPFLFWKGFDMSGAKIRLAYHIRCTTAFATCILRDVFNMQERIADAARPGDTANANRSAQSWSSS